MSFDDTHLQGPLPANLRPRQPLAGLAPRPTGGKRKWPTVAAFEVDLEQNLWALHEELRDKSYRPGPYRHFTIREPKVRRISAAPFRDRVVHHALMQVTWPIFEARMIDDSYACRVGKGTHRGHRPLPGVRPRAPLRLAVRRGPILPAVDHHPARQLARHIACADTLGLIDRILESGAGVLAGHYDMVYFPGDDLLAAPAAGLPIGNLTSQNWANDYLNDLDQFVKHELRCRAYLRYCDDFLLFADDKATLWAWRAAIVDRLAELRLTLHEERAQVYPVTAGIPWLGFRVFPDASPAERGATSRPWPAPAAQRDAYRLARSRQGQMQQSLLAWIAHASHGDTYQLRAGAFSTPGGLLSQESPSSPDLRPAGLSAAGQREVSAQPARGAGPTPAGGRAGLPGPAVARASARRRSGAPCCARPMSPWTGCATPCACARSWACSSEKQYLYAAGLLAEAGNLWEPGSSRIIEPSGSGQPCGAATGTGTTLTTGTTTRFSCRQQSPEGRPVPAGRAWRPRSRPLPPASAVSLRDSRPRPRSRPASAGRPKKPGPA